jgi:nucleotide-binding universal stress UspA family protein
MSVKTVLCAVDISNKNRDVGVLKQAARLAAIDDAQLDVITVVPDFGLSVVGTYFEPSHHEEAMAKSKELMKELVVEALGAKANDKVRRVVATGNAYEEILKAAKADSADLIVIGAQKPDFTDFLLGPNAARVVRHSTCSVYVVR